jgi:hypothetical protein
MVAMALSLMFSGLFRGSKATIICRWARGNLTLGTRRGGTPGVRHSLFFPPLSLPLLRLSFLRYLLFRHLALPRLLLVPAFSNLPFGGGEGWEFLLVELGPLGSERWVRVPGSLLLLLRLLTLLLLLLLLLLTLLLLLLLRLLTLLVGNRCGDSILLDALVLQFGFQCGHFLVGGSQFLADRIQLFLGRLLAGYDRGDQLGDVITELGHGILGHGYVVGVDDGAHLLLSRCKFGRGGAEGAWRLDHGGLAAVSGGIIPAFKLHNATGGASQVALVPEALAVLVLLCDVGGRGYGLRGLGIGIGIGIGVVGQNVLISQGGLDSRPSVRLGGFGGLQRGEVTRFNVVIEADIGSRGFQFIRVDAIVFHVENRL